jgi:hypothetical protein
MLENARQELSGAVETYKDFHLSVVTIVTGEWRVPIKTLQITQ